MPLGGARSVAARRRLGRWVLRIHYLAVLSEPISYVYWGRRCAALAPGRGYRAPSGIAAVVLGTAPAQAAPMVVFPDVP